MSENFAELLKDYSVEIQRGEVVTGTVRNVNRHEVIFDVGFKSDCAVPAEQFMDHAGRINVKEGEEVSLFVEEVDNGSGEAVLSREKAREYMGWDIVTKAFEQGKDVSAVVYKLVRGGLVLDLYGIQAFLPTSLVDVKPVKDPSFLINKTIDVKVVKLDRERNSVLVSRKATLADMDGSVDNFLKKLQEGDVVKGIVKNITHYGVFVDLGGVDGLLHITDMSWSRIESPHDICKIGSELEMKVTKYDKEKRRISLSLKEMDETPWKEIVNNYKVGDVIDGKVSKITDYGVFVNLHNNMEGLIHSTELSWGLKNPNPEKLFTVGQDVQTKIVDIDEEKHRVSLSVKRMVDNPWILFAEKNPKGSVVSGVVKSVTEFGVFVTVDEGLDGIIPREELSWSPFKEDQKVEMKEGEEIKVAVLSNDAEQEKLLLSLRELNNDPMTNFLEENKDKAVEGVVYSITKKSLTVKLSDQVYGVLRHTEAGIGDQELKDIFAVGDEVKGKVVGDSNRFVTLSLKALA